MRKESPTAIWKIDDTSEEIPDWEKYLVKYITKWHPAWLFFQQENGLKWIPDWKPNRGIGLMGGEVTTEKGDPPVRALKGQGTLAQLLANMTTTVSTTKARTSRKFAIILPIKEESCNSIGVDTGNTEASQVKVESGVQGKGKRKKVSLKAEHSDNIGFQYTRKMKAEDPNETTASLVDSKKNIRNSPDTIDDLYLHEDRNGFYLSEYFETEINNLKGASQSQTIKQASTNTVAPHKLSSSMKDPRHSLNSILDTDDTELSSYKRPETPSDHEEASQFTEVDTSTSASSRTSTKRNIMAMSPEGISIQRDHIERRRSSKLMYTIPHFIFML
ncbi:hypothetical protein DFH27DRAFT_624470 [Peziza echinospora]|nr:hypothetical protein DFH27DRAFT_624470 [Peziza echinospora]